MSLDCRKRAEYPHRTHTDSGTTCKKVTRWFQTLPLIAVRQHCSPPHHRFARPVIQARKFQCILSRKSTQSSVALARSKPHPLPCSTVQYQFGHIFSFQTVCPNFGLVNVIGFQQNPLLTDHYLITWNFEMLFLDYAPSGKHFYTGILSDAF